MSSETDLHLSYRIRYEGSDMMSIVDADVSVVIPAYNREKTIGRCLRSVLSQTVFPREVIVVDDGSSDNTIGEVYSLKNEKIQVIKGAHCGAQAARNKGIQHASGKYIAFLDSDDKWVENKLEVQVPLLDNREDVAVYSDCMIIDENNKTHRVWKLHGPDHDTYRSLLEGGGPMFQGLITSKKALLNIGLLDEKVEAYQEWETFIRLAKLYKMIHVHEPLFHYYYHDGETISKDPMKAIRGYSYIVDKHRKEIINNCGVKPLLNHYEHIILECAKNEPEMFVKYTFKWMYYRLKRKSISK